MESQRSDAKAERCVRAPRPIRREVAGIEKIEAIP
jgi:hypothetical protein